MYVKMSEISLDKDEMFVECSHNSNCVRKSS